MQDLKGEAFRITNHRLTPAIWCPSPNFNARPQGEISLLVIHNISLPPHEFAGGYIEDFFQNKLDANAHPYFKQIENLQVSAHLLINRQGEATQFVAFNQRAWHAGVSQFEGRDNCNDFSIGIEMEGTDNSTYTAAQYQSLIAISISVMQAYPAIIPERIVGHSDIAPQRKTDPGPAFEWQRYLQGLQV